LVIEKRAIAPSAVLISNSKKVGTIRRHGRAKPGYRDKFVLSFGHCVSSPIISRAF